MADVSSTGSILENYSYDIANRNKTNQTTSSQGATSTDSLNGDDRLEATREAKNSLDFEDMLLLMVTQLQNQTIDSTADTNDMMNQLIQMTVMQALTEVSSQVEEMTLANVMGYSASLVGQYVTLGVPTEDGKDLEEIYGQVEASGTYDGQQVIFVGGKSYLLSSIMAVGKLPPRETTNPDEGDEESKDPADVPSVPGGTEDPDSTENPDETVNGGTEAAAANL